MRRMSDLRGVRLLAALAVVGVAAAAAGRGSAGEPKPQPTTTKAGPLTVSSIEAVFVPAELATKYTVTANDTSLAIGEKLTYHWELDLERVDPPDTSPPGYQHTDPKAPFYASAAVDLSCNNAKLAGGKQSSFTMEDGATLNDILWTNLEAGFTWYHGDKGSYPDDPGYGCDHTKMGPSGHQGVVRVSVTNGTWTCRALIRGSNLSTSPDYGAAPSCENSYREELREMSMGVDLLIGVERRITENIGRNNKEALKELDYWGPAAASDAKTAEKVRDDAAPSTNLQEVADLDADAAKQDLGTKAGRTKALDDLAAALKLKKKALAVIDAAMAAQPKD
jgi:hypothetical protein